MILFMQVRFLEDIGASEQMLTSLIQAFTLPSVNSCVFKISRYFFFITFKRLLLH